MKTSNIIGILILIVLIGGGTYLYFQNQSLKNQLAEQNNLFSTTTQTVTQPTTNQNNPSPSSNTNQTSTPVIQSISPNSLNGAGSGSTVTIQGSGFTTTDYVIFNGGPGNTFEWKGFSTNGTTLIFTIPQGYLQPGQLNVTVVDSENHKSNSIPFTVKVVTPVIQSLSSTSGSTGTQVTVYGSGFTADQAVLFGVLPITDAPLPGGPKDVFQYPITCAGSGTFNPLNTQGMCSVGMQVSADGTSITFTIPKNMQADYWAGGACGLQDSCFPSYSQGEENMAITPGTYGIVIFNPDNQKLSNVVNFTVTN